MVEATVADRLRGAGLAARALVGRAWRGAGKPWRCARTWSSRPPERLLISPQDIRTADPTVAADVYAGFYAFAGKMVNAHGRSPFELEPPSHAWAASLASFAWLRHLRAADTALARANARALVDDFMTLAPRNRALPIWEPRVAARRLLAFLSQSPMILEGGDRDFYWRFMRALGRHAARLRCALGDGLSGETRLLVAIALADYGLCVADAEPRQRRASKFLADELTRQVLGDGGHVGRNPQTLIDLLLELLPLRQAYAVRGVAAPKELLNSIDRMLPMLRMFRLGDGSLALFNGMGFTQPHVIATVLAYDDARAAALANAPYSGYQRMEAAGAVVVMDTGAPPAMEFSDRAHAGQLSFEMTCDSHRLVGNCGAPDETRLAMREAARVTAAHATLTIADTSSSRFAPAGGWARSLDGQIVSGVRKVTVAREERNEGPAITASHDGYVAAFGLVHERTLQLAADGSRLSGVDRLLPAGRGRGAAPDYAVRFHLHPATRAERAGDGTAVTLRLPDGAVWRFHAGGMVVELEASINFAAPEGARPAEQIVLYANAGTSPGVVWMFEKADLPA